MSRRVFVSVSGGVVEEVIVPSQTDGTWTVIDWDNIEADPPREWNQFDDEDRAHIKANYPDDYAKYFFQLNKMALRSASFLLLARSRRCDSSFLVLPSSSDSRCGSPPEIQDH